MSRFRKKNSLHITSGFGSLVVFLIAFLLSNTACCYAAPLEDRPSQGTELDDAENSKSYNWSMDGSTMEGIYQSDGISVWKVQEDEWERMYEDPYVFRKSGNTVTNAWMIFDIPYMNEVHAYAYHFPEDMASYKFFVSLDGEVWSEQPVVTTQTNEDEEHYWTFVDYHLADLHGVRYLKVMWPETREWWNPYFGGIEAITEEPAATAVVIDTPSEVEIPRYDTKAIMLQARVLDQIGNELDIPIQWTLLKSEEENLLVAVDGRVEIASVFADQSTFTIQAETADGLLSVQKTFVLHNAILGDINSDLVVDQLDLQFVYMHCGANEGSSDWKSLRLADINMDGKIDVVDLAFVAAHMLHEQSEPEAPKEHEGKDFVS